MKTLEDQMSFYAAYHQDPRNKATHFVGVPTIVFSLMIPLGWLRFEAGGTSLTVAGTNFKTGAKVTVGGAAAGSVEEKQCTKIGRIASFVPAPTKCQGTVKA